MNERTAKSMAARVANECLATRTRSASRTITRLYDHALRGHGVTACQFTLLTAIALNGPIQPSDLGHRLNLEKSTLSRNLQIMKTQGWLVVRSRRARRGSEVELSAGGRRVLERAFPAWQSAQKQARTELGKLAITLSEIKLNA